MDEQQTNQDQEILPADESPAVESQGDELQAVESQAEESVTESANRTDVTEVDAQAEFDLSASRIPVDADAVEEDSEVVPDDTPVASKNVSSETDDAQDELVEPGEIEKFREPAILVEAILFTTDSPLPAAKISQIAQLQGTKVVKQAAKELNEKYERMGCSFRVEEIGGGYQLMTLPEYHDVLGRLSKTRGDNKLSQAGLEALAIIAYRQPILRADIEAIRGVASGEILRTLMEKQLVKIVGRAEVIGRPMLYGTTRRFLDVFGLGSLDDLPRVEELKTPRDAFKPKPAPAASESPAEQAVVESTVVEPAAVGEAPVSDAAVVSESSASAYAVATGDVAVELQTEPESPPATGEYQSDLPVR